LREDAREETETREASASASCVRASALAPGQLTDEDVAERRQRGT
jgi:hypothetical protein